MESRSDVLANFSLTNKILPDLFITIIWIDPSFTCSIRFNSGASQFVVDFRPLHPCAAPVLCIFQREQICDNLYK